MSQNANPETPKRVRVHVKSPQVTPNRYRADDPRALGDLAFNVVGVNPFNATSSLKSPMAKKSRKTDAAIPAAQAEETKPETGNEAVEDPLGEYRAWFEERFGSLTYDKDALGWFLAGWTSTRFRPF